MSKSKSKIDDKFDDSEYRIKQTRKQNLIELINMLKYPPKAEPLSGYKLAREFGVTQSTIRNWEDPNPGSSMPSEKYIGRVAIRMGRHIDGTPWTVDQLNRYLDTGVFPKDQEQQPLSSSRIESAINELPDEEVAQIFMDIPEKRLTSILSNLPDAMIRRFMSACISAQAQKSGDPPNRS